MPLTGVLTVSQQHDAGTYLPYYSDSLCSTHQAESEFNSSTLIFLSPLKASNSTLATPHCGGGGGRAGIGGGGRKEETQCSLERL